MKASHNSWFSIIFYLINFRKGVFREDNTNMTEVMDTKWWVDLLRDTLVNETDLIPTFWNSHIQTHLRLCIH